ncbi:hypothetical protein OHB56_01860 [Streptomyces sp. NBC_01635]|nr:hypothetical protein OHB56_01860 [Streptomyces sp. NBC_01635]
MPITAVMVPIPASVCIERQSPRPANRIVPDDTVHQQHKTMLHSHPHLLIEGFNDVVFAYSLYLLLPHLKRLSDAWTVDLGDDGDGLSERCHVVECVSA